MKKRSSKLLSLLLSLAMVTWMTPSFALADEQNANVEDDIVAIKANEASSPDEKNAESEGDETPLPDDENITSEENETPLTDDEIAEDASNEAPSSENNEKQNADEKTDGNTTKPKKKAKTLKPMSVAPSIYPDPQPDEDEPQLDTNTPIQQPDNPLDPDASRASAGQITVDEGALEGGSGQHTNHGFEGTDNFRVDLNGGSGTIQLFGQNDETIILNIDAQASTANVASGNTLSTDGVEVSNPRAVKDADTWTVSYDYQLKEAQRRHADPAKSGSDDVLDDGRIGIVATSDGGDSAVGEITVAIHDDAPASFEDGTAWKEISADLAPVPQNVILVVNLSEDMLNHNSSGASFIDSTRQNLHELLDSYQGLAQQGIDVKVSVVGFGTVAQNLAGGEFVSIAEARTVVNNYVSADSINEQFSNRNSENSLFYGYDAANGIGSSNYDAALNQTIATLNNISNQDSATSTVYFVSGSEPSHGSGGDNALNGQLSSSDAGISSVEQAIWQAVLASKNADSFAYKLNRATDTNLAPVTYDHATDTQTDAVFSLESIKINNAIDGIAGSLAIADGAESSFASADGTVNGEFTIDYGSQVIAYSLNLETGERHSTDSSAEWSGTKITVFSDTGSSLLLDFATGTFKYTPSQDAATNGEVLIIRYDIVDGDGDKNGATTKLEFTPDPRITNVGLDMTNSEITTDEAYLSTGTKSGQTNPYGNEGSFTVDLYRADGTIDIGDDSLGKITLSVEDGKVYAGSDLPTDTITINGVTVKITSLIQDGATGVWTVQYSVELGSRQAHGSSVQPHDKLKGAIPVSARNSSTGMGTKGAINVAVIDDVPEISVIAPSGEVDSGTTESGAWSHNFGADVPSAPDPQIIAIGDESLTLADGNSAETTGSHGTLTVYADGTYSYKANPNTSGTDTFAFAIQDSDGDKTTATLAIVVRDSTVKPAGMTVETRDENVLANGSDAASMIIPAGYSLTQDAVDEVNGTIDYGQFSLDGSGNLVFTQSTAYTHATEEDEHTFPVAKFSVTDPNTNATTLDVTVTIADDVPTISTVLPESTTANGNPLSGDLTINYGADGPADANALTVNDISGVVQNDGTIVFTFDDGNSVVISADETRFTFRPAFGFEGQKALAFAIKDIDGDTAKSEASVTSTWQKFTVTVPGSQIGYTLSANNMNPLYGESVELSFALTEGYSKTDAFAVKANGVSITLDESGKGVVSDVREDLVVTVEGVADITPPAVQITLNTNSWDSFQNDISFDLFFNESQTVNVAAQDAGSGVNQMAYYLSDKELTAAEAEAITSWAVFGGALSIDPDQALIIYVKATDHAGNTAIISSDGVILDATAPAATLENNAVYDDPKTFTVTELYLNRVVMDNGEELVAQDGVYTLPASNVPRTVVITDKAGNETSYSVTVYENFTVSYNATGHGSINGIASEKVRMNESPSGSTHAAENGYRFTHWTADKDVTLNDGTQIKAGEAIADEQVRNIVVTADVTLTAIFEEEGSSEPESSSETKSNGDSNNDNDSDSASTPGDSTSENQASNTPGTNDEANIALWLTIMLSSFACFAGIASYRRKSSHENMTDN